MFCTNRSKKILSTNDSNIFLAFEKQNNLDDIKQEDKDLHVFIPDESSLEESLEDFKHLYSKRTRLSFEFWLLDVTDIEQKDFLETLPTLDIDDDLFLYETSNQGVVTIWEYYDIHPTVNRKMLRYGTWSMEFGLETSNATKWVRRSDFEVSHSKLDLKKLKLVDISF